MIKCRKMRDIVLIEDKAKTIEYEKWFLLRADVHNDSPDSDRKMEARHLREAVDRDAHILDFGDLFDAMQGRDDPRRMPSGAREEHRVDNYLDSLIESTVGQYRAFYDRFLVVARGNHEESVLKRCGVDLTSRLKEGLNACGSNGQCISMPCRGFIRFKIDYHGGRFCKLLHFTHGSGGAAPITQGIAKARHRSSYLPDADIVVSGHSHNSWTTNIRRLGVTSAGNVVEKDILHIQIPGYKKAGRWEESMDMLPKPTGAYWLRFYFISNKEMAIQPIPLY